jgi:hypothetical protein
VSFTTLRDLPADELREGDWPVSLAGYRPIERIKHHPRKRTVVIVVGGIRHELYRTDTIGRVRRPVMAALKFVRTSVPAS